MPKGSEREIDELTQLANAQTALLRAGEWEAAVAALAELRLVERIEALTEADPIQVQKLQLALSSCITEAERLQAEAAGSFQQVTRFRTSVQDASDAATSAATGGVFVDEQL